MGVLEVFCKNRMHVRSRKGRPCRWGLDAEVSTGGSSNIDSVSGYNTRARS
jgi:hypothetical protein